MEHSKESKEMLELKEAMGRLNNVKTLKKLIKDTGLELVLSFSAKISTAIETAKIEREKELAAEAEKEMKMQHYLKMIRDDGIDPQDLLTVLTKCERDTRNVAKKKTKSKYQYTIDGKQYFWSGKGRMPKLLRQEINFNGKKLEDFL